MSEPRVAAIVLAGGRAKRLGGESKANVEIGGARLIETVVRAAQTVAPNVVVVGPEDARVDGAALTREEPAFGGPLAGVAAGWIALDEAMHEPAEIVLLLACDMPGAGDAIGRLLAALAHDAHADGAWVVDAEDREQPLLAVYRASFLSSRLDVLEVGRGVAGRPMRTLTEGGRMVSVIAGDASADADTWEDVERMRAEHG